MLSCGQNKLRAKLFDHMNRRLWAGRHDLHSSDIMERMKKDVDTVTDLVYSSIPSAVIYALQVVAAVSLLAVFDWRLAIVLVCIMPICLLGSRSWLSRMRELSREIRQKDSSIHTFIQEHLRQRVLEAAFLNRESSSAQLLQLQSGWLDLTMKRNNYSILSRSAISLAFAGGYTVAFLWGVNGLMTGAITFGIMTAFLQLVAQVQRPTLELAHQVPAFIYATASAERLQQLLDLPVEQQAEPQTLKGMPGIRLRNLSFRYADGDHDVIRDLSFDFRPGQLTAITGPTGAGKTTLLRLLLALVKPTSGKIEIYSEASEGESEELSAGSRADIVYVPQGNSLFTGTIRQNLLYANAEASESQLLEALATAQAGFVGQLTDGLDTLIGEGGLGLSEGQAQRIAIARALLRPGRIVLLDEPTSALDPQTEQALLKSLTALSPARTIILITHRQQTAEACPARLSL